MRSLAGLGLVLLLGCGHAPTPTNPPTPLTSPAPSALPATAAWPGPPAPRDEAALQAALGRDILDVRAYEELARLYYERSRTEPSWQLLARRIIDQGLAAAGRRGVLSGDLLTTRGLLALARGRTDRAHDDFIAAVRFDAHDLRAQAALAATALHIRDYARARPAFLFVTTSPHGRRDMTAWMGLGMAEQGLRRFEAAALAFRRASALAPADPRPHYYLAEVLDHDDNNSDDLRLAAHHRGRAWQLAVDDARFLAIAEAIDEQRDRESEQKFCGCHYPIGYRCHTRDQQEAEDDPVLLAARLAAHVAEDAATKADREGLLLREHAALTLDEGVTDRERLLLYERIALADEHTHHLESTAANVWREYEVIVAEWSADRAETQYLRLLEREVLKAQARASLHGEAPRTLHEAMILSTGQ